jgi:hypothetical protein
MEKKRLWNKQIKYRKRKERDQLAIIHVNYQIMAQMMGNLLSDSR